MSLVFAIAIADEVVVVIVVFGLYYCLMTADLSVDLLLLTT